ncbi:ferritin-like domain-containing protein [Serpentinicella alkaliphila]|uniref:Rubrerythrin n=1 Tax=Serpentinicella alkaliphila TaxID=1734049 RepID=A0A4R2TM02_9FIRM|nr:ferritin-like domain-containing protein [Serpentinicella alkaliphila]TCP98378.1 rubrerythrin [Serpentinicella alkaliphila]
MANISLSKKETLLLKDQKKHEEMCIIKYNNYANQAQDPQLKQIFLSHAQQEQEHLDTINQILNGQIPSMQNLTTKSTE